MSLRLNADILLEIVVYLEGTDRLSLALVCAGSSIILRTSRYITYIWQSRQSCSLVFRLSQSPSYWGRKIAPSYFNHIKNWKDYSGEEYRVAALRTTRVRDSLALSSKPMSEFPASFAPGSLSTLSPSMSHSMRHLKIPNRNRKLRHVPATQWLVDMSKVAMGEYTFIDLKTNREFSTKVETATFEADLSNNYARFAVESPRDILLMRPVITSSWWASFHKYHVFSLFFRLVYICLTYCKYIIHRLAFLYWRSKSGSKVI
jgi:hypothetical protein